MTPARLLAVVCAFLLGFPAAAPQAASSTDVPSAQAPSGQIAVYELRFPKNYAYLDEEHLAILDDIALRMQRSPDLKVVFDGRAAAFERPGLAYLRARGARAFLVESRGVDASRIVVRTFGAWSRPWTPALAVGVEAYLLPPGAEPASIEKRPADRDIVGGAVILRSKSLRYANRHYLREQTAHCDRIASVNFSPDGRYIATAADDGFAHVWDVRTGTHFHPVQSDGGMTDACVRRDARSAAVGRDGEIKIWSSEPYSYHWNRADSALTSVASAPDANIVAGGGLDGNVYVWDAEAKEINRIRASASAIRDVVFAAGGNEVVTASDDGSIVFWDTASGRELRRLAGHTGAVTTLALSSAGDTLMSLGLDQTLRLWDTKSGREKSKLDSPSEQILSAAIAPDGRAVATGGIGFVRTTDVATGKIMREVRVDDEETVDALAFAPDGRTLAAGDGVGRVHLFDAATLARTGTLETRVKRIRSAALSRDSSVLALGVEGGKIAVCDASRLAVTRWLEAGAGYVEPYEMSPDGRYLSTIDGYFAYPWGLREEPRETRIFDTRSGVELARTWVGSPPVPAVADASQPGGLELEEVYDATAKRSVLRINDVARKAVVRTFVAPVGALSSDERLVALGAEDGTIEIVDVVRPRRTRRLAAPAAVKSLAFARSRSWLAAATSDGAVTVWDARSGEIRWRTARTAAPGGGVVSFAPDGSTVTLVGAAPPRSESASGSDENRAPDTAFVLDARNGKPLWRTTLYDLSRVTASSTGDLARDYAERARGELVVRPAELSEEFWGGRYESAAAGMIFDSLRPRLDGDAKTDRLLKFAWNGDGAARFSDDERHVLVATKFGDVKVSRADSGEAIARLVLSKNGELVVLGWATANYDAPTDGARTDVRWITAGREDLDPSLWRRYRERGLLTRLLREGTGRDARVRR